MQETSAFLSAAEREKEKRYYDWLSSVRGTVVVFYAAASTHGCLGKGLTDLLGFCAKQRAAWAGALEQQSLQGAFRFAWESRILLTVTRAAFIHAQKALVKLVPMLTAPKEGRPRSGRDPLLNAGVFPLREAVPSGWSGEVGENPFDTF